jgi:hypothetical protein
VKGKSIHQSFAGTLPAKSVPRGRLRVPRPRPGAGGKGIEATQEDAIIVCFRRKYLIRKKQLILAELNFFLNDKMWRTQMVMALLPTSPFRASFSCNTLSAIMTI